MSRSLGTFTTSRLRTTRRKRLMRPRSSSPFFRKIIKARWFSRAWCMHEHLTSRIARLLISKPRWYKCRPDLAAELPGPARLGHVRDTWSPYRSGPPRNARDEQAVGEEPILVKTTWYRTLD